MSSATLTPEKPASTPVLENGDRLNREEFERRYHAMSGVKKAELIEGIVYMPSPVRLTQHGRPFAKIIRWLGEYEDANPGSAVAGDCTIRLDMDNEPQPDAILMRLPEAGGQAGVSADGYIEGAPEFVAQIVASTQSYDLHQKKEAYRRNGVREYLAWIVREERIVWWELHDGNYREIQADAGLLKSRIFPGLWLDPAAMIRGDMKAVFAALESGLAAADNR